MKSPKTKFVVISAIGLVSIVGIFVFAQAPTPGGTSGQDLPVQLVMACVGVKKAKLLAALAKRPKDTYKFQYGTEEAGGGGVGGGERGGGRRDAPSYVSASLPRRSCW